MAREVRALAEEAEADEVMITTPLPNQRDRLRTVEGFAQEWGLHKPAQKVAVERSSLVAG